MRRLISGCAGLSLAIGALGVGGALGMGGAQATSAATGAASDAGALADFNRDGFVDLAVGNIGVNNFRGAVQVTYGSANRLAASRNERWTRDSLDPGTAKADDDFGSSVATGDFDGDGFTDLAVGAAGENESRGAVHVLYGSASGLTAAGNQLWTPDSPGILGKASPGDGFGIALAAANFGKSGHADLAVSAPNDNHVRGAVSVIYGSASGLRRA